MDFKLKDPHERKICCLFSSYKNTKEQGDRYAWSCAVRKWQCHEYIAPFSDTECNVLHLKNLELIAACGRNTAPVTPASLAKKEKKKTTKNNTLFSNQ